MGGRFWYQEKQGDIRLGYEEDGTCKMSVDVYPSMGFKTAGLRYKENWLQPYQPDWSGLLGIEDFGNTVLFPTPNRVRDGVFTFRGRRVEMKKKGVLQSQHGLAKNASWKVSDLRVSRQDVSVTAAFHICPGDENYAAFPYSSCLTMTYCLEKDRLICRYCVKNTDDLPMPFGIGLHPWFLLPRNPERVSLCVPAEYCYETTPDLLPTGKMIDVGEKAGSDLNVFCPVRELDLDTVYLTRGRDMRIRYEDRGYQLTISQSPEFMAGVVFTAFNRGMENTGFEAFCVESQTCCTDAINMHEKGFHCSGLMILEPGEEKAGYVSYTLTAK